MSTLPRFGTYMMYHIKKDILGTWNLIHVNGKAPSCVDSWVKDLLVGIYNTNYQLIFVDWSIGRRLKLFSKDQKRFNVFFAGSQFSASWHILPWAIFEVLASNWNMSIFSIVLVSWLMIGWESSKEDVKNNWFYFRSVCWNW